ncbi:MAG: hypothetical protein JO023_16250, partial [Chloroflexi bacterium]|nr:hypothetical protein [Chloroflexota bacterium]
AETGTAFLLIEFYSYLLNVYDSLAHLDAVLQQNERDEIEQAWGHLDGSNAAGQPAWVTYFAQIRRIVDRFYPEIPSQRPVLCVEPRSPLSADASAPVQANDRPVASGS